jgi:hypothetical protein
MVGFVAAGAAGGSGLSAAEIFGAGEFVAAVVDHVVARKPGRDKRAAARRLFTCITIAAKMRNASRKYEGTMMRSGINPKGASPARRRSERARAGPIDPTNSRQGDDHSTSSLGRLYRRLPADGLLEFRFGVL